MDALALRDNPLRTHDDMQRAVVALCEPVESHRSPGGARIALDGPRATHPNTAQEMEGYSRLLWGIAPLVAGGGSYTRIDRVREGLCHGCDPAHPEYWGCAGDRDQRLVECGAIACALLLHPETFWQPLSATQRGHVAAFLGVINEREVHDNNWRFFRVLVNLALARCDAPYSAGRLRADLDRLDTFHLGDGWYVDGSNRAVDYYGAFGMHFYGLICAKAMQDVHAARGQVFAERAAAFATRFVHWFSVEGAAIPFGRSLTYRFAPAAFWGALAYAGVEALPWGTIKGLLLRHLRWWFKAAILSPEGLLTIGYAYQNQLIADRYSSACSPYWALKAFLPLAVVARAPFWQAEERTLPDLDTPVVQEESGMILCRDDTHLFALAAAARVSERVRHAAAKYGKFCYSTCFGFSLPAASRTLQAGAHDSSLAFSEQGDDHYRARERSELAEVRPTHIVSHWKPWPDVFVTTWLVPMLPWHVRVHRVRTVRSLTSAEGGFAVGLGSEEAAAQTWRPEWPADWVGARTEHGISVIGDMCGARRGEKIRADPNTNVLWPRTIIPTLRADLPPGEHWLACAAVALPASAIGTASAVEAIDRRPTFALTLSGFEVRDARGEVVLSELSE